MEMTKEEIIRDYRQARYKGRHPGNGERGKNCPCRKRR